jgi:mannose-6-phosphate isomerase
MSINDALILDIREQLIEQDFNIIREDLDRPWGGFFAIDEKQAPHFIECYFDGVNTDHQGKRSPKILFVEPGKRLSWQYHHRRAELWKVLEGPVGVVRNESDEEAPLETYQEGEVIRLAQGERHRLVGLDHWGVVAEIWQHTIPGRASDEDDIVRLQDDFGRS